jgi:PIN domain nuclease of toxin-antitoxin system
MKLLLDTHIFIWWADEPDKLPTSIRTELEDENNTLVLSVVSAWEIQIKYQLNRLTLSAPLQTLIESQQQANELQLLPVELPHVLGLHALPHHHSDPFDRLLIAQAITENCTFVSVDAKVATYSVKLLN